jgi:uncharacterized protein (TIGR00369 family)
MEAAMTAATAQASQGFTYGLVPRETVFGMTGLEFLQKLVDRSLPAPPFAQAADIWISEVEAGRTLFEGKPSIRFYNPLGSVHGGWIATLLDSAMGCAVHTVLKAGQVYTTVDMNVSFVRPVFDKTGIIRCEGKIIHAGSRIATSEGRVWDKAGTLIAHGTETCAIMNLPGAK